MMFSITTTAKIIQIRNITRNNKISKITKIKKEKCEKEKSRNMND